VISDSPAGAVIKIRVIPRAGRTGLAGTRDGALLVRLAAAPVDGAANAALIELLAKTLSVPKRSIAIVSGETSRTKRVRVEGITAESARAVLGE
jgi:hypothetical protein